MRPEDLQARLRVRGPYEAMDLGYALMRRHWRPVMRAWFVLVTPIYLMVWLVCWRQTGWALFLVWWLKPLWDRIPHFVISRALFGQTLSPMDVLRAGPWRNGLFLALTLHRLSYNRTFLLSVPALEQLKGRAGGRRREVLARRHGGAAVMMTLVSMMIEMTAFFGLIGLVSMMVPDHPEYALSEIVDNLFSGRPVGVFRFLLPALSFAAMTIAEPLYVAAGFGLYINRRSELEGWDIELTFRRMALRLSRATGMLLLLVTLAVASLAPAAASAQAAREDTPAHAIEEVLSREEFGGETTLHRYRLRYQRDRNQPQRRPRSTFLNGLRAVFASLLEVLLWSVIAGLVAYLVFVVARTLSKHKPVRSQHVARSGRTTGGVATQEVPPPELSDDEVLAEAWRLWNDGEHADALGVIYHGTTQRITPDGESLEAFTESDWLLYAAGHLEPQRRDGFEKLVDVWMRTAYAHHTPEESVMKKIVTWWRGAFHTGAG